MVLWEYSDEYSPEGLLGDGRRGIGLSYVSLDKKDSRIFSYSLLVLVMSCIPMYIPGARFRLLSLVSVL